MRGQVVGLIVAGLMVSGQALAAVPTDNPQVSSLDKAVQAAAETFFDGTCHVGLSIGYLDHGTASFYNYGTISKDHPGLPTRDSLYEIASITKTFTGALAAKAVVDGRMTLDADFRTYLDGDYPNLAMNGKPITLRTLASHSSGLPKNIPDSDALFANADFEKLPYQLIEMEKDYDTPRYLKELHDVALRSEPGAQVKYSNLDIKVIGFGLEHVYGATYDDLLTREITGPLKMTHTGLKVTSADAGLLVTGYSPGGNPMPYHLYNAGANGGLYSSTADMVRYIAWHLDEIDPVVKQAHGLIRGTAEDGNGLIWLIGQSSHGGRLMWHTGGAYGMSSIVVLYPDRQTGVILLANDGCFDTQTQLYKLAAAVEDAVVGGK